MGAYLRPALMSLLLFTVVTGIVYPLVVTGIAQAVFPSQANGSLIVEDGKVLGSTLIGQTFDQPQYFWGRPSATSPFGYNAAASAGSNLSPTNQALIATLQGARGRPPRGRPAEHRSGARRSRHRVEQRTRSAHQPGGGSLPGASGSPGA
jgi:K+-transporting ATPase KdpC subunit